VLPPAGLVYGAPAAAVAFAVAAVVVASGDVDDAGAGVVTAAGVRPVNAVRGAAAGVGAAPTAVEVAAPPPTCLKKLPRGAGADLAAAETVVPVDGKVDAVEA
jgi:hypothetical protein